MSAAKISIIMPIHNTPAEYLEECLGSVFAQTFTDFELICVDDASSNEMTKAMMDVYENKHENMWVIHLKESGGAATARNTGFLHAKSEYVIFLDADDVFEENFLLEMHQCIEEHQADLCACGYTTFHGRNREDKISYKLEKERVFDKNADEWLLSMNPAPWNKLYRRQFLTKNNIYFQSLPSSNDVFFYCMSMICAKSICILEKEDLIFYRIGTKGQISANRNPIDCYKAVLLFLEAASNYYCGEKLRNWSGALLISHTWDGLSVGGNEESRKELYLLMRNFFTENPVLFENQILEACKNNVLQLAYESNWYGDDGKFLWQLKFWAEEIKPLINRYRDIYLWGMGKRGDAFQKFCEEEGIALSGVADIKDSNIEGMTEYGNKIFATRDILEKESGCIVASNRRIYEHLKEKTGCFLVDLEEFCPV